MRVRAALVGRDGAEAAAWVDRYRRSWSERLDSLAIASRARSADAHRFMQERKKLREGAAGAVVPPTPPSV